MEGEQRRGRVGSSADTVTVGPWEQEGAWVVRTLSDHKEAFERHGQRFGSIERRIHDLERLVSKWGGIVSFLVVLMPVALFAANAWIEASRAAERAATRVSAATLSNPPMTRQERIQAILAALPAFDPARPEWNADGTPAHQAVQAQMRERVSRLDVQYAWQEVNRR